MPEPRLQGYTLIGMPGSGKSTIGVVLAKHWVRPFVDTDIQLQNDLGMSLQTFLDQRGIEGLRRAESECVLGLSPAGHIVATGGSVVYSEAAMRFLREQTRVIYLQLSYENMCSRLGDYAQRGIAADLSGGLRPMFEERQPLYERYAEIVIDANQSVPEVLADLLEVEA